MLLCSTEFPQFTEIWTNREGILLSTQLHSSDMWLVLVHGTQVILAGSSDLFLLGTTVIWRPSVDLFTVLTRRKDDSEFEMISSSPKITGYRQRFYITCL